MKLAPAIRKLESSKQTFSCEEMFGERESSRKSRKSTKSKRERKIRILIVFLEFEPFDVVGVGIDPRLFQLSGVGGLFQEKPQASRLNVASELYYGSVQVQTDI